MVFLTKKFIEKASTTINPIIHDISVFHVSASKNRVVSLIPYHGPKSLAFSTENLFPAIHGVIPLLSNNG